MENAIKRIEEEKIIAIVRGVAKEKLIPLAQALFNGGIRIIECTYDASGRIRDEETASYIETLGGYFGPRMLIGAGTVLTEKQVILTKKAGGNFVISPDANEDVIKKTKELGLVSIPGALTPTEITRAKSAGADFIKIFPVNAVGGTDYIKAVAAPLSNIRFLAVGGVNEKNISTFLKSGFCGAGIGNGIVNTAMLEHDDYNGITNLAKKFITAIKEK